MSTLESSLSNSYVCYLRMVRSIKKLLIPFCFVTFCINIGENRTNHLGQV